MTFFLEKNLIGFDHVPRIDSQFLERIDCNQYRAGIRVNILMTVSLPQIVLDGRKI